MPVALIYFFEHKKDGKIVDFCFFIQGYREMDDFDRGILRVEKGKLEKTILYLNEKNTGFGIKREIPFAPGSSAFEMPQNDGSLYVYSVPRVEDIPESVRGSFIT